MAGDGLNDTEDDMILDSNIVDLASKLPADPVQRLGFSEISGTDTVNQLTNQLLNDNTAANAISSLRAAALNKIVTPVWKLSQYQSQSSSCVAIEGPIWKNQSLQRCRRYPKPQHQILGSVVKVQFR